MTAKSSNIRVVGPCPDPHDVFDEANRIFDRVPNADSVTYDWECPTCHWRCEVLSFGPGFARATPNRRQTWRHRRWVSRTTKETAR